MSLHLVLVSRSVLVLSQPSDVTRSSTFASSINLFAKSYISRQITYCLSQVYGCSDCYTADERTDVSGHTWYTTYTSLRLLFYRDNRCVVLHE